MDATLASTPKRYTRLEWLQFSLFWSWNLIFLAFMSFGFAPVVLPETLTGVRTGVIPASFLVFALLIALVPVATVVLGLTALRRSPSRLFALGYVIEGPLMLMLAIRFFAIRQTTPGTLLLMSVALLGMAAFLWGLLDLRAGERRPAVEAVRLAGLTLMGLTSLYAAAWIAFYALPLGMQALRALGDFLADLPIILRDLARILREMLLQRPVMLPFSILGFILLLYTATLFVLTPIAVPYLSLRAWLLSLRQQAKRSGWLRPALVSGLVIVLGIGLFFLANLQPQAQAFAWLENPPTSASEAQDLIKRSSAIRAGLLNAYLAPYRYISAEGEVRHIRDIYSDVFAIPERQAYSVQRLYEGLASPLLYQPVHQPQLDEYLDNHALTDEPPQAARLYQRFFDATITEAERPTIVRAVRTTWQPDQAQAAWQAVDDREVHLARQELNLQEHGDWAEAELMEEYQNQTARQQEVIYYFNLPESAVLTGVWLGNSPDKAEAFSFQVAPRGAAQAVYREETRQMRDPALLEQIGPRQYRLRVFPIPPLQTTFDERRTRTLVDEAPPLYMWLDWRQMADSGVWRLPQMAFLRNVYWDSDSQRLVNGETLPATEDEWLPAELPVAQPSPPLAHRVDLPGGQTVLAIPAEQSIGSTPTVAQALKLAVVVDRSRSMQPLAAEMANALRQLKETQAVQQPVDVYLTASPYRGEEPSVVSLDTLDLQSILYFGGQNAAELLAQYEALRGDSQYDAVILLTDGTGYELGDAELQTAVPESPMWIVHLGGDIPLGYDDNTLQAIQASGGGVAGSLDEALARLAVSRTGQPDGANGTQVDLLDGYLWSVLPKQAAAAAIPDDLLIQQHAADDPFAALAARRLVLAEMQRQRGSITQVETLDALHTLAMDYQIVTPYSSMIVLVAGDQQVLLDRLSELDDRYQREVEALGETAPNSPLPLTGVPEPHEWLLLGLVAALLLYYSLPRLRAVARPLLARGAAGPGKFSGRRDR